MPANYSLSTSIFYPNGEPHMGHALEWVHADFIARARRAAGDDVYFQIGLDEHGSKIARKAAASGMEPAAFVAGMLPLFTGLASELMISADRFIRTSADPDHTATAQALWKRCAAAGDLYKRAYRAWYDVKEEEFLGDADQHPDPASFGRPLEHVELIEEENWFFRASRYQEAVRSALTNGTTTVVPESRLTELLSFIDRQGIADVSVSRQRSKLEWGVPVPDDADQVMYVWFDALSNYLSGTTSSLAGSKWPMQLHVIGKDIARFHALLWPAMLLSAGLPLPEKILVHGHVLSGGRAMSKTIGNVVAPSEGIAEVGADGLRWFLLSELPTAADGEFTLDRLRAVYASDLANDYGNLVSRVFAMARSYCGGIPKIDAGSASNLESVIFTEARRKYDVAIADLKLDASMVVVKESVSFLNRRIEELKPWAMAKADDPQELWVFLYELIESIRMVTLMIEPAVPAAAGKLRAAVGAAWGGDPVWGGTVAGGTLPPEPIHLFPRAA